MNLSLTQQWLQAESLRYSASAQISPDIIATLQAEQSLRIKSDIFTFDDGRTQSLLCLHGLLPIHYKNNQYNIPVAIWLTLDYPVNPPIVFVVPTSDMLVRPSRHVDPSGRCSIEYIQLWQRKHEGCNLQSLVQALQTHFSQQPPVYAKAKTVPSSPATVPVPGPVPFHVSSSPAAAYASKPPPPLPYSPPALPPKPATPGRPPHSVSPPVSTAAPPSVLPRHSQSLPIPGHPPPPPPPPALEQSPVPFPIHSHHQHHLSQHQQQHYHQPSPPPPPPPPTAFIPPQARSPPPAPIPITPTSNLLDQDEDEPNASLPLPQAFPQLPQSQAHQPPPPLPPNPELLSLHAQVHHKISAQLDALTRSFAQESERLRSEQSDLLAGHPAIQDEMARLQAVRDVCRTVGARLSQSVQTAERNLGELKRKGDPEVDELVCSTSIVHNQLVNLVAEDNAIEDTIYHLHRALNAGRIDLERFLRTTRILAEEQFMKRALIEKIQAGLSPPVAVT